MALVSCDSCRSDDDIHLEGVAPDGSRILRCGDCGHTWSPSARSTSPTLLRSPFEMARGRFATAQMVDPAVGARVDRLREQLLETTQDAGTDPAALEHRARYRRIFSADGLAGCDPQELRDFVSNPLGGSTGNTSMFARAWKSLGDEVAADRVRTSVEYLLRGPDAVPLEDRLTHLVEDREATGMPGFKEALLTKVLCVTEPDRFLPVFTYGAVDTGKRDLALAVYGLHLPKPDPTSMRIGRLAVWSNDLLLELAGPGLAGPERAAAFLRWAGTRVEDRTTAPAR